MVIWGGGTKSGQHVPYHIQGGSTVTVKMMNRDRIFFSQIITMPYLP